MNIELVGVANIDQRWAMVAEAVAKCLKKAPEASVNITAADVWNHLRAGNWHLMLAWNDEGQIVGVTIWQFLANGYYDCAILTGAAMRDWFPEIIDAAKTIAKTHGCKGLVATGRPGLIHEIMKTDPETEVAGTIFAWRFKDGEN